MPFIEKSNHSFAGVKTNDQNFTIRSTKRISLSRVTVPNSRHAYRVCSAWR
ncbi:hypothetical protein D918_10128 [Trichuris suis]|nr:hypothetical protein D918_10128 [Trichuris suis]